MCLLRLRSVLDDDSIDLERAEYSGAGLSIRAVCHIHFISIVALVIVSYK